MSVTIHVFVASLKHVVFEVCGGHHAQVFDFVGCLKMAISVAYRFAEFAYTMVHSR